MRLETEKMAQKLQENLQKEVEAFQKIQKDLQKVISARQQLDAQYNENKTVKDELDLVKDPANVYKLTGPVLVKQDLDDAKMTVQKRIDYIQEELKRHEKTIGDMQGKQDKHRDTLAKLQQQYQVMAQKQQQAVWWTNLLPTKSVNYLVYFL